LMNVLKLCMNACCLAKFTMGFVFRSNCMPHR
jgi:hypothetical protein